MLQSCIVISSRHGLDWHPTQCPRLDRVCRVGTPIHFIRIPSVAKNRRNRIEMHGVSKWAHRSKTAHPIAGQQPLRQIIHSLMYGADVVWPSTKSSLANVVPHYNSFHPNPFSQQRKFLST